MDTMDKSRPLNIVHVILSRGFAGSERSTAESCNQQCQHNQVTLVVRKDHRRHGASIVDHVDSRVQVIELPSLFFTRLFLARALAKIRPDIVHAHLRRSTRLVAKVATDAKKVSTLHITVNGPHFARMDGLIANARWQLEDIPPDFRGQVFKANNSLIPHRRLGADEIAALRRELEIDDGQMLIGAVGRYKPTKGWDTLIKAFLQLPQYGHVRLLFFGAGSLENELKAMAADDPRVRFIGFRNDIKDLYQVFDLAVCPSRFEPLPRVMLEAMDGGAPLIASDIGGCIELIEDYGGVSFEVDNVGDLKDKLAQCIENPPPRHRPDLSAHYIENANQAMLDFYRRLIEAN
jgi:glycosyltransferase involved in cell wall biosynthesis